FCNTSQRLWCSLSSLIRSPAHEDAPRVQHLSGRPQPFDHDPTCALRGNVLFASVLTPGEAARMPQDLHGGPGPEPAVFLEGEVAAFPGAGIISPGSGACVAGHH